MNRVGEEIAEVLHTLLAESLDLAVSQKAAKGICDNLHILCHRAQKIRNLTKSENVRKIGVFGPPKRGKSTLLNVLLRQSLLPTGKIPMTSAAVELRAAEPGAEEWEITVYEEDGFQQIMHFEDWRKVAQTVEQRGSHRGFGPRATKIEIQGPFERSPIFEKGGILVDTPGAEAAFKSATEESAIAEDTRRALEMLRQTHVVIFCVRVDQLGSESELAFYHEHIRLLRPLNVVNFRDRWTDDGDPVEEAARQYNLPLDRSLAISSKQGMKALEDQDEELMERSGVLILEHHIVRELDQLTPEHGIRVCFAEYLKALREARSRGHKIDPGKLGRHNLQHQLKRVEEPKEWGDQVLQLGREHEDFWNQ